MSDIPPGTMIELEVVKRFHHYNVGDKICEPPGPALELVQKRLARTTGIMKVPGQAAAATADSSPTVPQRSPGTLVRK